jgi:hypothetical protein
MNETDFIRQQLTVERAHLREILHAVRRSSGARPPRAAAAYIDWAGRRVLNQVQAHCTALQAAHVEAQFQAPLEQVAATAAQAVPGEAPRATHLSVEALLAVVEAWSEPLDALAGRTLRTAHWRKAAQLSADTILEERQLFTAARSSAGLS